MAKRKMTKGQTVRAHRQGKRLKGKPGIKKPFALATYQVKKGQRAGRKKKTGK
jgi:hypothetical protein